MAKDENQEGMPPHVKRFQHKLRREQLEREGGTGSKRSEKFTGEYGIGYPETALERRKRWKREHRMWHEINERRPGDHSGE